MPVMDWGEYWWSTVTGPRAIVASAISALKLRRSVILHVPQDLPWRHELRKCVLSNLESIPGLEDLELNLVDIEDEGASKTDPGRTLLNKYALRADKTKYREGGRESIQDYLMRKNVMRNRLVWVKGIGANCSQKWVDFCEQWRPNSIADGILVIETREQPHISSSKRVEIVRYEDRVSEYDVQLFNSLVIDRGNNSELNVAWKKYAAAITTHLCGSDAEIARCFIEQHDFRNSNPIETLRNIDASGDFNRRGSENHVLALYRNEATDELLKRIWVGQIEILFPLIERERLKLIDTYRAQFERETRNGLIQFDNRVDKPEDIELGTMVYMLASKRLSLPDHNARNRIHVLRDCRNSLAHRDVCSLENVSTLLDNY